ncbi:Fpg/Nei family DNA glycosylase [Microbacterium rhizomatis]|uniref:Fpg/Nei family DNA glycosylase n=1 Tax=Microbacterium rhizomatis TaxID=1631477 RepID=A0A5J5J2C6_9MICO|nr:DNA-formamidopyrimidine glycosylase family protein [Microbacterium rhizomatis]KAA9110216.1 Fpg/Nei family DNA glycosylase [Microbacterium rhizomatis]
MPESPEVQALAEFLADRIVGREISGVDIAFPKALKSPSTDPLIGCRITGVVRRGKLIDISAEGVGDPVHLVVHWGHDGWLLWHDTVPVGTKRAGDATLMARIRLSGDGPDLGPAGPAESPGFDLTDSGQWKALSIFVVADPRAVPAVAKLGPDPLDDAFSRDALGAILAGRRKQLKALLQDQSAVAGIGNAYSDEILHAARLSPVVHAAALSTAEIDRLHDAMRSILSSAVLERRGLAPEALKDDKRANMRVHRRPGEACPVCGDTVREFTFSGAAAHYCPTCQTNGVALA